MKIQADYLDYISGKYFQAGLVFPISESNKPDGHSFISRLSFLEAYCRGKSVLHVGCADHLELIEGKRKDGTWLHGKLSEISASCVGIDINREAVNYIRNQIGMSNVFCADITREVPDEVKSNGCWDVVILGELLEHISNPDAFMRAIHTALAGIARELILTVPNAFRLENYKKVFKGFEFINSDHRFWFTPYTLAKIVSDAGFTPTDFYFVTSFHISKPKSIGGLLNYRRLKRFPALRDTIVMSCTF